MFDKQNLIATLPGLRCIKDLDSNFTGFSQEFAELLGWKSADDPVGKTDHDIPCAASRFAEGFREMDKMVYQQGKKLLALDIQSYTTGWKLVLAEKSPIFNKNKAIIGSFHQCTDVSDMALLKPYLMLHHINTRLLGNTTRPASYILSDTHRPFELTEKQGNCLFLLVRGKTNKEIAKMLKISPRTVECHVDAIKHKLACPKRADLIAKAIDGGYLYYVPENFQKSQLIKIVNSI